MKKLTLLALVLLTSACSTPPKVQKPAANPNATWEQRKVILSEINDWVLNGRVAIVNGEESWHLNLSWQRHGDKYILDLSGPFGAGRAQLTGTDEGVILVDADKNYFYADSPDRLLYETTRLRMPVESLLYWMRGIPNWNIKNDQQTIDIFGRLATLHQNGWRVRFKSYNNVEKYQLPEKIFIDGFNLKVKIFVDEWDLKSKKFNKQEES